jgi:hypothetical protein
MKTASSIIITFALITACFLAIYYLESAIGMFLGEAKLLKSKLHDRLFLQLTKLLHLQSPSGSRQRGLPGEADWTRIHHGEMKHNSQFLERQRVP